MGNAREAQEAIKRAVKSRNMLVSIRGTLKGASNLNLDDGETGTLDLLFEDVQVEGVRTQAPEEN